MVIPFTRDVFIFLYPQGCENRNVFLKFMANQAKKERIYLKLHGFSMTVYLPANTESFDLLFCCHIFHPHSSRISAV